MSGLDIDQPKAIRNSRRCSAKGGGAIRPAGAQKTLISQRFLRILSPVSGIIDVSETGGKTVAAGCPEASAP